MPRSAHILIFTRYPVPGRAKTRLIPSLGPLGAARLHRRMTEHILSLARTTCEQETAGITVCFTGARQRDFRAWLGRDLEYAVQPSGDLGHRLRQAFEYAFRHGAKRVIAIGADVPAISTALLAQALTGLHTHDVVLGPAADGGYYLIGLHRYRPELFIGMDWGTERVCAQTRTVIQRLKLKAAELPTLEDVDRPEDLPALQNDPRFVDVWTEQPQLSIIIPTLNEAGALGRTLENARRGNDVEIIVVDGGSQDATRELAEHAGATVLAVSGGRAAQQNAGAAVAQGRLLLFLHADTLLPENYAALIRRTLADPATVAGAFRFRTDGARRALRVMEWVTNIRSIIFQWPYGDQGLFMEKRVFKELQGFAPLPIMEDFDLVRRLRQRGRVITLPTAICTSARRWQRWGVLQTTLRNQLMIAGFLAGVSPTRLARFYRQPHRNENA